ncbi:hypothetical protein T440DRAFT_273961 [Plenodomus tracheiphilus IPT5]|uniref:Uncharacterized protein n=1 Tax=Plenodomus tracheiphilus IPT5 TaxID=1408161 RepID=A0A6A7BG40_9PLEO|nr:hypothetical protein T440DRAFT_273961 [Plenodomus tracheiphilus IPT5]
MYNVVNERTVAWTPSKNKGSGLWALDNRVVKNISSRVCYISDAMSCLRFVRDVESLVVPVCMCLGLKAGLLTLFGCLKARANSPYTTRAYQHLKSQHLNIGSELEWSEGISGMPQDQKHELPFVVGPRLVHSVKGFLHEFRRSNTCLPERLVEHK